MRACARACVRVRWCDDARRRALFDVFSSRDPCRPAAVGTCHQIA